MASTRKEMKCNIEVILEMKITIEAGRSTDMSAKRIKDLEDGLEKIQKAEVKTRQDND